jgi:hypothetical protein
MASGRYASGNPGDRGALSGSARVSQADFGALNSPAAGAHACGRAMAMRRPPSTTWLRVCPPRQAVRVATGILSGRTERCARIPHRRSYRLARLDAKSEESAAHVAQNAGNGKRRLNLNIMARARRNGFCALNPDTPSEKYWLNRFAVPAQLRCGWTGTSPATTTPQQELVMKLFTKTALVLALGFSSAAFAGEIRDTTIRVDGAQNAATGDDSRALQRIGVANSSSVIRDSEIDARGAGNLASGANSRAAQDIGVAVDGGRLGDVLVRAVDASNRAAGDDSIASQEIGKAVGAGNNLRTVTVLANGARNAAAADNTRAEQKIGVAE